MISLSQGIILKLAVRADITSYNYCYTILASGIVGKTGKVISVEPNKSVFSRLLNNIQSNHLENDSAFNFALSDFNGTAQLYLSNGTEDGQGLLLSSIEKHSVQGVEVKNFNEVFSERKIDMIKMGCGRIRNSYFKKFRELHIHQ